jgi:CheY-like chemotaxis protein
MAYKLPDDAPIMLLDDDSLDIRIARHCHGASGLPNPLLTFQYQDELFAHLDEVEAGRAQEPALMLLDIRLPGLDGFQVLERVRQRERFRSRPAAIMLTTSRLKKDRERADALGCAGYMVKPMEMDDYIAFFRSLGTA